LDLWKISVPFGLCCLLAALCCLGRLFGLGFQWQSVACGAFGCTHCRTQGGAYSGRWIGLVLVGVTQAIANKRTTKQPVRAFPSQ
jgi:hypothetical protein